jgi:hypothetical protein
LEKLSTVSYITNFWAATEVSTANLHRKEIQAAILSNINNAHFDQVVVLLDGITEHANCTHFFDEMQQHSNFSYIYNACNEISSWAFHLTQKMHKWRTTVWKTEIIFEGEYVVPEPHTFASKYPKCVKSGDCFVQ